MKKSKRTMRVKSVKKTKRKPTKETTKETTKKAKVVEQPEKKRYRYRECPACYILNDSRFKRCTDCGNPMYKERERMPPKNFIAVDWHDLTKGEEVYILSNDVWFSPVGEAVIMSDSGLFKVIKITQGGILTYGVDVGFAFFDMVTTGTSKITNIKKGITKVYKRKPGGSQKAPSR